MDRQGKISAILDAVHSGRASKRQIDVGGKGKAVKKLEAGQWVSEEKLDEMYAYLIELGKIGNENHGVREKLAKKIGNERTVLGSMPDGVREKLANLEKENLDLKCLVENMSDRISFLEGRLDNLEKTKTELGIELDSKLPNSESTLDIKLPNSESTLDIKLPNSESTLDIKLVKNMMGWTITEKEFNGKKYWYAAKTVDGKTLWVYIGKDRSKAEEKIRAKYPELLKE